jgi:uracil phosphoribosyltransferase
MVVWSPTKSRDLLTKRSKKKTHHLNGWSNLAKEVVIVPILRAGLGMVDGIHYVIPTHRWSHRTLRDEKSLLPTNIT